MSELVKESVRLAKEREHLMRKLEHIDGSTTTRKRHTSELTKILKRSPEELAKQIKTQFVPVENSNWSTKELIQLYLTLEEELRDGKLKLEYERKARVNLQLTKQELEADIAEMQQSLEGRGYDSYNLEEKLKEERLKTRREAAARQALELMNKKLLSENQDMATKLRKEREHRFHKKEATKSTEHLHKLKNVGSSEFKILTEEEKARQDRERSVKDKMTFFERGIANEALKKEKEEVYDTSTKKRNERTKSVFERANPLITITNDPPPQPFDLPSPPSITRKRSMSAIVSSTSAQSPKTSTTYTAQNFLNSVLEDESSQVSSIKSDNEL